MVDYIKNIVVIPVRLSSSRFPNKPLVLLNGKTMIEHTWARSIKSNLVDEVLIATPDKKIKNLMESKGAIVVMTSHRHEMCMDRVNEAVQKTKNYKNNIIVVQGDEPLINANLINKVINNINKKPRVEMISLVKKITDKSEENNPNRVKVVYNKSGYVHYISREKIPSSKKYKSKIKYYKLICVYGLSGSFLKKYSKLKMSYHEKIESIDILRVIDNNYKLKVIEVFDDLYNIDTKSDVSVVKKMLKKTL